ncbi:Dabb family protein [Neptunicella sp.]|uniref:Dabb family protein n=1 Tax=Neptunicella sp. TaxID=2125986 RepID=UPI003F6946ED
MTEQHIIESGGFVHTVFFWLQQPENAEHCRQFEQHLSHFINHSDYVKSKHIGKKSTSERDVVDSSYDYCLIVTFNDKAEQVRYQNEPAHLTFIQDASHLWKQVKVYDSQSIL